MINNVSHMNIRSFSKPNFQREKIVTGGAFRAFETDCPEF